MGLMLSKLFDSFAGKEEKRLVVLGLDAAGKTTLLYKLKLGEVVRTMPTIGFNCETVTYKSTDFVAWDVGGQDKLRPLWRHYFHGSHGIVFVVDSNDTEERLKDAKAELDKLLADEELKAAKLLVFANKQDMPRARAPSEVAEKLGLHGLRERDWFIQGATATTGDGLYEGLDWLVESMKKK